MHDAKAAMVLARLWPFKPARVGPPDDATRHATNAGSAADGSFAGRSPISYGYLEAMTPRYWPDAVANFYVYRQRFFSMGFLIREFATRDLQLLRDQFFSEPIVCLGGELILIRKAQLCHV